MTTKTNHCKYAEISMEILKAKREAERYIRKSFVLERIRDRMDNAISEEEFNEQYRQFCVLKKRDEK